MINEFFLSQLWLMTLPRSIRAASPYFLSSSLKTSRQGVDLLVLILTFVEKD
jgi:hypothetical protein